MNIDSGAIVIIGASSGIGEDTFKAYRRLLNGRTDVDLIGVARSVGKLEELTSTHGGTYYAADMSVPEQIAGLSAHVFDRAEALGGPVRVLYGAGIHEPMSIDENGERRFVTREDFFHSDPKHPFWEGTEKRNHAVNVQGVQDAYNTLLDESKKRSIPLRFVYISSLAAQHPDRGINFEKEGNPFYAVQKRGVEEWLNKLYANSEGTIDVAAIRFGMAHTPMANQLLEEGRGLIPFWHINQDPSAPLKPAEQVTLPVPVLTRDIVAFIESDEQANSVWRRSAEANAGNVVEPEIAFEYILTPEQARQRI